LLSAVAAVCAVVLGGAVVPTSSLASTTFGADLGVTPSGVLCGSGCTAINTALPAGAPPLTSPVTGTIIRWRIKTAAGSNGTITFRVIAPAGGGMFTGAGTGATETTPTTATTTTFPTQLPIQVGDYVGVDFPAGSSLSAFAKSQTGANAALFTPALVDGGPPVSSSETLGGDELLVNADVAALPTSSVTVPACSDTSQLAATVTSDPDQALAPKAIHFRIDGGSEQVLTTSGNPGSATISVPEGSHTLEYWGEDTVGGLESPHHTASVQVGCPTTPPTGTPPGGGPPGGGPPGVAPPGGGPTQTAPGVSTRAPGVNGSTSAAFSGSVNPEGASTTAYFQYGLDPSYTAGSTVVYDHSTPPQAVGSDFSDHSVSATVTGLVPNARYHVQVVASNGAGTTVGQDQTFVTKADPAPPAPGLGTSVDIAPMSGQVFIEVGGSTAHARSQAITTGTGFVPLTEARQIPTGSQIDSRYGKFRLTSASGKKGKLFSGTFGGSIVAVSQANKGADKGLTTFRLLLGVFPGAPNLNGCSTKTTNKASGGPAAEIASLSSVYHSSSHGRYRTRYGRASGSSLGTKWDTIVSCAGVRFKVFRGTVVVNDSARHKTVIVHAGQSYLAKR
jgi:hypothetical protein